MPNTLEKTPSRGAKRTSANEVIKRLEELCAASAPGERLPTRAEMVKRYDASERSVLRALDALEQAQKVVRRQGSGVFVAGRAPSSFDAKTIGGAGVQEMAATDVSTRTIGMTAYVDEALLAAGQELPATLAVLKSIEETCKALGMATSFINRWTAPDVEQLSPASCVRELLESGCDYVVVVDIYSHPYVLSELRALPDLAELPIIYISTMDDYVPCSHVHIDNRDAGYQAAEILRASGYDSITFLSPYRGLWVDKRISGARLATNGHPPMTFHRYPQEGQHSVFTSAISQEFVREALAQGQIQGGIIAAHDRIALDLIKEAAQHGLKAGVDYGLVAFDDDPPSFTAGLTTLRLPLELLGQEAVRIAHSCMTEKRKNLTVSLRADLVLRRSHLHP